MQQENWEFETHNPRPATDPASAIRAASLGRFVAPYALEIWLTQCSHVRYCTILT